MRIFPSLFFIFSMMVFVTNGQIIHIPSDYPTIQEGINAATEGDTVLVAPGTYFENLALNGANITLASNYLLTNDTSFISLTIIDGGQAGTVITINQWEDTTTRITGFSITNGLGESDEGGGITIFYAGPLLDHLYIFGNRAQNGGGISLRYCQPVLNNCSIQDNNAINDGGGIFCMSSTPIISDLNISGNHSTENGGGFYLISGSPNIINVSISDNSTVHSGGGLYIGNLGTMHLVKNLFITDNQATDGAGIYTNGNLELGDFVIKGNSASNAGGGVNSRSNLHLFNSEISENTAYYGGGIYCAGTSIRLDTVDIVRNISNYYGGGMYCAANSESYLDRVNLSENHAEFYGGGIYCNDNAELDLRGSTISLNHTLISGGGIYWDYYTSTPHFDTTVRCNIYLNAAGTGNDLYSSHDTINIVVDTFTVIQPTDYHTAEIAKFTFDILHGKTEQPDADLYVSPDGDNANSGLTPEAPLKTINRALQKLRSDSDHQHTVHLSNGVYSPSTNGDKFPIQLVNYSSLEGESRSLTILDAEKTSRVLNMEYDTVPSIMNLTLTGGKYYAGAGIGCVLSEIYFNNIKVTGNTAVGGSDSEGGGIGIFRCGNVSLNNMIIEDNQSDLGGGIFSRDSKLQMYKVELINNHATSGGGIYLYYQDTVSMDNMKFIGNDASELGGGIYAYLIQDLTITNSVLDSNRARRGGGIWAEYTSPVVKNSLITNNSASQFCGGIGLYIDREDTLKVETEFYNVTFADNSFPGLYAFQSGVSLINSIFWDNDNPYQVHYTEAGPYDTLLVKNSNIQGGYDGIFITGSPLIYWLPGNINEDPQFLLSGNYPYALADGSPCIDAGTPDTTGLYLPFNDIIGNTRIWDGDGDGVPVIDMGPYEFGAPVDVPDDGHLNNPYSGDTYIFPNPASDHLTIGSLNDQTDRKVTFVSSTGQVAYSTVIPAGQGKLIISLDYFSQGLYTVLFSDEGGVFSVKKVVVIN
jgi:predicted outer membrane repeat protein